MIYSTDDIYYINLAIDAWLWGDDEQPLYDQFDESESTKEGCMYDE